MTMAGDWIFTPDEGCHLRRGGRRLPALRLLAEEDDDADGATTYNEVETFAEAMGFDDHPHRH